MFTWVVGKVWVYGIREVGEVRVGGGDGEDGGGGGEEGERWMI